MGTPCSMTDMHVIASSDPSGSPVAVTSPWRKTTPSRRTSSPNSRLIPSSDPGAEPRP